MKLPLLDQQYPLKNSIQGLCDYYYYQVLAIINYREEKNHN